MQRRSYGGGGWLGHIPFLYFVIFFNILFVIFWSINCKTTAYISNNTYRHYCFCLLFALNNVDAGLELNAKSMQCYCYTVTRKYCDVTRVEEKNVWRRARDAVKTMTICHVRWVTWPENGGKWRNTAHADVTLPLSSNPRPSKLLVYFNLQTPNRGSFLSQNFVDDFQSYYWSHAAKCQGLGCNL